MFVANVYAAQGSAADLENARLLTEAISPPIILNYGASKNKSVFSTQRLSPGVNISTSHVDS